jgi:hypothetical protein
MENESVLTEPDGPDRNQAIPLKGTACRRGQIVMETRTPL